MKLSTKGRYGARAMLDLAIHYEKKPIMLKSIAKRQAISVKYLEHIMKTLVAGGLIEGTRGKNGGFSLSLPPDKINLGQIISLLEGSFAPAPCLDHPGNCDRISECVTREIWGNLQKVIEDLLSSYTLQDMVAMFRKKNSHCEQLMFYI